MAALEAEGGIEGGGLLNLSAAFKVVAAGGADGDADLVPDVCDNCPLVGNNGQQDDDEDGLGNVCDSPCSMDPDNDADGDGQCGNVDPCPFDPNNDADSPQPDGVCGDVDNCPTVANANQVDQDKNGIGDACQSMPTCSDGVDNDGDGFADYSSDPGCSDANDTTETNSALPRRR